MVRPVPELCFWWTISQSCLGLLRLLGLLQGPGPADLFSGFAVSQSTSVSEPMPPFNLTNWRTDSHIRRVEAGKMVRPVPELCIWRAISLLCLGLLRSDVSNHWTTFFRLFYRASILFFVYYFKRRLTLFFLQRRYTNVFLFVFDNSAYKFIVFFNDVI